MTDPTTFRRNLAQQFLFGRNVVTPGGTIGWLADDGLPNPDKPEVTWLTARTAHVYSLAAVAGFSGSREIVQAALTRLGGALLDHESGGWLSQLPEVEPRRECYVHAHVVLAAAAAVSAGFHEAEDLLERALTALERFWSREHELYTEVLDADWSTSTTSLATTPNMHCVEALLAAADALDDPPRSIAFRHRAGLIVEKIAVRGAGSLHGRIPQRLREDGTPDLLANASSPADPFTPFGAVIGLAFEWSRLTLAAMHADPSLPAAEFIEAAELLYATAKTDGWSTTGYPGFCYSTDWNGGVLVPLRFHWVHAEAISAAVALSQTTGVETYDDDLAEWWAFSREKLIDDDGSWRHELDETNGPSSRVWDGRPDLYHSTHAALFSATHSALSPMRSARAVDPSV